MCGIAGILNVDGSACDASSVHFITEALTHRGPDGCGFHIDGPVGLGHRRLRILDLTESATQPLSFSNRRYWITYNGEVYNFLELRRELEDLGQCFRSQSDTEVVVAAYDQWGADCVLKFNGMWAFAIWDSHRRELFLSRDRFGVKPLHYLCEPRRFVFASELKSFLYLPNFTPHENEEELRRALGGMESQEDTLLAGVKLLLPGHNATVSLSGKRIWRWWYTLDHVTKPPKRFHDQVDCFRELFFDACHVRMRSDVPIGTCLSGGMDSSSILCSIAKMPSLAEGRKAQRIADDFHRAFVATFAGTSRDEREYAEAAIREAQADARYYPMHACTVGEHLRQYAYDFEMIGHTLLIPVWMLYRELRRDGVVVSIDGLGCDELMGYGRNIRSILKSDGSLLRCPIRTLDLARTIKGMLGHGTNTPSLAGLLVESDPLLRSALRSGRHIRELLRGTRALPLDSPSAPQRGWSRYLISRHSELDAHEMDSIQSLSPLGKLLYDEVHYGANQSLLRKYDRLSMAHGIEVRLPFLDWRLVCYVFSLPDESKVGGGMTKRVLREAMRGILPEKIRLRKPKIGFDSPMQNWLNAELGDWIAERANTKAFLESHLWDGRQIRDFVTDRNRSKTWTDHDGRLVWRYFQADLWREAFFGAHAPVVEFQAAS